MRKDTRRTRRKIEPHSARSIPKTSSGIQGLDELTGGGLPRGRTTLVCGGAGCGKTLLGMEFLICGAREFGEPGVFLSFEETEDELIANASSLRPNLRSLIRKRLLQLEYVHIERSEVEEAGAYDLAGLFIRLEQAIDSVGAKRVVIDTIEALFAGLEDQSILRAEVRRLFRWLKAKGVTAIVTGERGEGSFTRHGLEEYVSDCVILLDHRVEHQISTRRLRVVKYRGSVHGTNEYPFIMDDEGFSVLPVTSLELEHRASRERVSSGIAKLDQMMEGKGYFRGSTILVSGTAGTGKTSIAAHFADAACRRGERTLYFCYEESRDQLFRNMESIGRDLGRWEKEGLLTVVATRPSAYGLEMHLVSMNKEISRHKPRNVIVDPITNLITVGEMLDVRLMLTRLIDSLKSRQITALFTSLTSSQGAAEDSEVAVSSLIDTWLLVREIESSGERNRGMYILKSRGMSHSNQVREFLLTDKGIDLVDVYVGPDGILTGSARKAQEAHEAALAEIRLSRRISGLVPSRSADKKQRGHA